MSSLLLVDQTGLLALATQNTSNLETKRDKLVMMRKRKNEITCTKSNVNAFPGKKTPNYFKSVKRIVRTSFVGGCWARKG